MLRQRLKPFPKSHFSGGIFTKKSHDHTQLTRLAAISLVVVMCLSALPMLAPSASASGTTYTWTAASDGHYGSDTNPTGDAHQALIARIIDDGTQRHFDVGDLVDSPNSINQYEAIRDIYDSGLGSLPYHVAIGNHDNVGWLMDTFGLDRRQYTVVDGDYAWIVLDSSFMYTNMNPYSHIFLEEQLNLLRDKLVFIVAHVPQRDVMEISTTSVDNPYFIDLVRSHAYHIGAVVFSHVHLSDYQVVDGVPYVNTGTFGRANLADGRPCYISCEISSVGNTHTITISNRGVDPDDNDHMFTPQTHTVTIPPVIITPPVEVPRITYVWDGEGGDAKASTAANWYRVDGGVVTNDIAPASGSAVIFNDTSAKNCTWDLDIIPYSITLDYGYRGIVTQQSDVPIKIGYGGYMQWDGQFRQYAPVTVAGRCIIDHGLLIGSTANVWQADSDLIAARSCLDKNKLSLRMTGTDAILWIGSESNHLNSLNISGAVDVRVSGSDKSVGGFLLMNHLSVSGTMTIESGSALNVRRYGGGTYTNSGSIHGPGELRFVLYNADGSMPQSLGDVSCPIVVMLTMDGTASCTMSADGNIATDTPLIVRSYSPTYSITFDPDDHNVSVSSVTVEPRSVLLGGESRITTTSWDTTAGGWEPEGSTVILRDGGSARLAPGQSFNRLEIASDDGRTASWSMTATGTVSPIVTGLKSGVSYRWYLDGVEQGVIEAGEDGTIALSYQSTGLHTLEVKSASMAAMDGVYQAVGIVAVLAVLGGLFTMVGRIKY